MSEQTNPAEGSDYDFIQSQELFSENDFDNLTNPTENQHGNQLNSCCSFDSDTSLFHTEDVHTPLRTRRQRVPDKLKVPSDIRSSSDSSDYEPPRKPSLKEIFECHFGKKNKNKKDKRKKYRTVTEKKSRKPSKTSRKIPTAYLQERRRRLRERAIKFPCTAPRNLQLNRYFAFEQSVFGGFLLYLEKLKFDRHLQNSLKVMDLGEDIEDETLETRRYGYLDDDGPISPISEHSESSNSNDGEQPNYDAKIVENGSFILNCNVPSKRKWNQRR
ncbi:hypothetical protein GDO86_002680 [Hymenochirus boettgeri]|uniref:TATA box-binding protein-associated factor RNA polymerase I subunit D n=1 Tax=Hymenochirus boettgeri TaxID=247094 RepID=A0A8T2K0K6_9PIPI|nr:hypothetical protein GDO86_002680 [Hymenochirus boettgeri]